MHHLPTIEKPTFYLPDYTPGELDYMAQGYTSEMYAIAHLFRQQSPSFNVPVTYALNSFYQKKQPHGKIGKKQSEKGERLLDELLTLVSNALIKAGWTYKGVSPNNGKTSLWQPPQM